MGRCGGVERGRGGGEGGVVLVGEEDEVQGEIQD